MGKEIHPLIVTFFSMPAAVRRHQQAPFFQERDLYLDHLAHRGAARATLRARAVRLLWIARELDLGAAGSVAPEQIRQVSEAWAAREQRSEIARAEFACAAKDWLRFLGRLAPPEKAAQPFADLIEDFATDMEHERGLSPATIRTRRFHAGYFCSWYQQQGRPFREVSLIDVDAYLLFQRQQRWSRRTVAAAAMILRAFFRHLENRNGCPKGLADAIQGPCIYVRELLPMGPSWEDVRRLIDSVSDDHPSSIRAKPILLLFAVYGLRVSEVAQLRLDDVDWEEGLLAVRRPKQRRAQQYPLVREVGDAILRYLRETRPRTPRRELFLTRCAPPRPLSPGTLFDLVSDRLKKLQIRTPHSGPHALRHACATHLLCSGLSFKEIGDHLGHRSASATAVYAKVDMAGLRRVADFDLGGLL
jgi:site-specific recombinase XerD